MNRITISIEKSSQPIKHAPSSILQSVKHCYLVNTFICHDFFTRVIVEYPRKIVNVHGEGGFLDIFLFLYVLAEV